MILQLSGVAGSSSPGSPLVPPRQVFERRTWTEAILAHRGMINDFIGDAIRATFGAPAADPEHALHAVQSAVAMDRALHELNRRWEAEGRPTLRMGVAVHTGEVFAGNVGGSARLKYAVVGDPVNVAARLEGLNKKLGTTLLITEATRMALGGRVDAKDRGMIALKGRTAPLHVHECAGDCPVGDPNPCFRSMAPEPLPP